MYFHASIQYGIFYDRKKDMTMLSFDCIVTSFRYYNLPFLRIFVGIIV